MNIELIPDSSDEHVWHILVNDKPMEDYVFERPANPGRYFVVLRSSTLNALGTQMAYHSFDDVLAQLKFYYHFT